MSTEEVSDFQFSEIILLFPSCELVQNASRPLGDQVHEQDYLGNDMASVRYFVLGPSPFHDGQQALLIRISPVS